MKDEIKKKIEEEALRRFPFIKVDSLVTGYPYDANHEKRVGFIEGLTQCYSLAQQSVNSDILEAVRIMPMYLSKIEDREHRAIIIKAMNICEDSSSQNQQNEKESDAMEFMNWSQRINGMPSSNYKELYELFKQSKTNPPTGIKQ